MTKQEILDQIKDTYTHAIAKRWGIDYYSKAILMEILSSEKPLAIGQEVNKRGKQ